MHDDQGRCPGDLIPPTFVRVDPADRNTGSIPPITHAPILPLFLLDRTHASGQSAPRIPRQDRAITSAIVVARSSRLDCDARKNLSASSAQRLLYPRVGLSACIALSQCRFGMKLKDTAPLGLGCSIGMQCTAPRYLRCDVCKSTHTRPAPRPRRARRTSTSCRRTQSSTPNPEARHGPTRSRRKPARRVDDRQARCIADAAAVLEHLGQVVRGHAERRRARARLAEPAVRVVASERDESRSNGLLAFLLESNSIAQARRMTRPPSPSAVDSVPHRGFPLSI